MTSSSSIQYIQRKSTPHFFTPCRLRTAFFSLLLFSQILQAQICDKKTSIYFDTDQYELSTTENQKLEKLAKVFAQKKDTFMLEVYAFTDSIASVEYNYKLATNRLKTIVRYLRKHSDCYFEIKERVRGEAQPLGSNGTEEGRSKNRRADVFYWKISNGRITLQGQGGTEIEFQKKYFESCGVCESNPKMREVFTNEEADQQGIPMTTIDGDTLVTGGMMSLQLSGCDKKNKRECADVVIRIPAPNYDEEMQIWRMSGQPGNLRWTSNAKEQLEYDAKNKCYLMKVNYCAGDGQFINADKPKRRNYPMALIAVPNLVRTNRTYVTTINGGRVMNNGRKSDSLRKFSYDGKGSVFFVDSGIAKNKIGYTFAGSLDRYEANCNGAGSWCFEVPIDAYTEIIYFQKRKNYRLKLPYKYRNYAVKLYIPAADTLLSIPGMTNSKRKYSFLQPLPDTYIVVYGENVNSNNKRGYDGQVSLDDIRTKHKRRHHYYKAKIKRRQLKKAISSNSVS